ncbi:Mv-ORF90 peptide [Maruca vitrata nucleopolyhedrovirus]|uniref:Mv-ORF90 peptide n=1 Tax=Maruca vitrata nucleopolyhedrovirus TaxID=1307954 RepID=A1YRF2_9ABAC|nr:Mv-ORF90 peptide [Maruca vitrata nucleopolyhedrovirus]ABL76042.1 Mv-ORF90 peptide [Maruca vitrata nucleopolyhedrovirus]
MHLTANVLLVSNALKKRDVKYIYNTHLKNYSIIEGVMCCNGDCLVVAVLDQKQLQNIDMEVLESLEYSNNNIELLREKICVIVENYDKYYQNE